MCEGGGYALFGGGYACACVGVCAYACVVGGVRMRVWEGGVRMRVLGGGGLARRRLDSKSESDQGEEEVRLRG